VGAGGQLPRGRRGCSFVVRWLGQQWGWGRRRRRQRRWWRRRLVAAADEIADIIIYVTRLADKLGIDIDDALEHKLAKNAKKHPVS
jgi:hypothetical protein